jgi:uncharacterized protein
MSACPICARTAQPREVNTAFPFCSARCRQVDLGRWLDEAYRIPAGPDEDGEDDRASRNPALEGA